MLGFILYSIGHGNVTVKKYASIVLLSTRFLNGHMEDRSIICLLLFLGCVHKVNVTTVGHYPLKDNKTYSYDLDGDGKRSLSK